MKFPRTLYLHILHEQLSPFHSLIDLLKLALVARLFIESDKFLTLIKYDKVVMTNEILNRLFLGSLHGKQETVIVLVSQNVEVL